MVPRQELVLSAPRSKASRTDCGRGVSVPGQQRRRQRNGLRGRSLLSEGCVSYQVPQKDENGNFTTVEKRLDGPTSFITTTIIDKLEAQLEDRLFTIHPDESMGQTRSIMNMTAKIKDPALRGN
jgi:hypothetical protein